MVSIILALAAIALALFGVVQMDAKRQEKWRRDKLKSIEARKAKIAARKRGQSDEEDANAKDV